MEGSRGCLQERKVEMVDYLMCLNLINKICNSGGTYGDEMLIGIEKAKQPKKEGIINSGENKIFLAGCLFKNIWWPSLEEDYTSQCPWCQTWHCELCCPVKSKQKWVYHLQVEGLRASSWFPVSAPAIDWHCSDRGCSGCLSPEWRHHSAELQADPLLDMWQGWEGNIYYKPKQVFSSAFSPLWPKTTEWCREEKFIWGSLF